MSSNAALLWLRNDLRLLDQPLATVASAELQAWIYVFDLRFLSQTVALPGNVGSLQKASPRRALFLLQAVRDLASSVGSKLQAQLIVRIGKPEEEICDVAKQLDWNTWDVHCQTELGTEEQRVQDTLAKNVSARGGQLLDMWGQQFLYHPHDVARSLSVDPVKTLVNPHHFWQEDADPEAIVPIRNEDENLPLIQKSKYVSDLPADVVDPHALLTLPEAEALVRLGYSAEEAQSACLPDPRAVLRFVGGETAALARLEEWIKNEGLAEYYENRSGLLGPDYSSKLSPWLASGCISPVRVYRRIRKEGYDDSVKWFISELGWRDLFRYHTIYHGARVFMASGPARSDRSWTTDKQLFDSWCIGQTGLPYIDAHMRELAASGFMSNTGRQVVAAFLSCCLGLDWRLGAMWFESTLIDHDVCLNYGNWNREARVRWSGRKRTEDAHTVKLEEHTHLMARLINAEREGSGTYDTEAFIRSWIPELRTADKLSLLCRRSPPPVYEILCSSCSSLDKSSTWKNGKLLCSYCSDACAWCGCSRPASYERPLKRKWYCSQCSDGWDDSAMGS